MSQNAIHITEPRSGLSVIAPLLAGKAPENVAFFMQYLSEPRIVPGIHAMWTGPEISCPIPAAHLEGAAYATALPAENATVTPQPGDIVLSYVPARMWGGSPNAIFDIGLFYGQGARLLFPIGWLAGTVMAQVRPEEREHFAAACGIIRRNGGCDVTFALTEV
ncbi:MULTISPECIES: DUF3830 family protein [Rhizobium]|uniref:DUF3830 family protein n=1 Tax=Rhizobium rhododendri TaxID=2506430 RepID=A0ABY8IFY4_9HYPH|nr:MULTISPECIES: DUF3830 family protein [Rhizobium]MBZ5759259.1 DUF3830 family protein [Rhizobium sp. VS19-DR96]MBZ5763910.1 DUF3830 family protein [Rhizobium sp. VS19-DR129.2]MBZ5771454.1 DUF3830 family protein [Rhizobium sp. VS19-DRK62.2]MBZ5783859.1 DUF3830 family protein [Rhizobium sp. VS19-DR121]MBZ5801467.1 DUF3830 family protein [Rhizobium sp. VS19-DR181]